MCIQRLHFCTMKDVGIRIRLEKALREQFFDACHDQDKPAAQVLREFMRDYVARHQKQSIADARQGPGRNRGGNG